MWHMTFISNHLTCIYVHLTILLCTNILRIKKTRMTYLKFLFWIKILRSFLQTSKKQIDYGEHSFELLHCLYYLAN